MKESEERYKIYINTIPDIIYEVDTEGRFIFVNDAIKQLGYSPKELIGKHLKEIIHPDDIKNISRIYVLPRYKGRITGNAGAPKLFDERRSTATRITKHLEVRLVLKNPESLPYCYGEIHSYGKWDRPVSDKNKKLLGSIGIIRDITKRKLAEEELKEIYEKLKSAQAQLIQSEKMAGIGQIAAGITHEIKNPLAAIIGNLEMLYDYSKNLSEEILKLEKESMLKKRLKILSKNLSLLINDSMECTKYIQKIISQLLTFSHRDMGELQKIDINEEIDKSISLVGHELNKCEIIKDLQPLPQIIGNPIQISQVFINLLVNAAQSIKDKGEITIKTYMKNSDISIEFTDTGEGIPKELLDKIFEPFFSTKGVGKGTGLGLSVIHNIVKNHHGTIDVISEVGKGTTFTVKLPVKRKIGNR